MGWVWTRASVRSATGKCARAVWLFALAWLCALSNGFC